MKNLIFASLFCFGASMFFTSCEKCVTCTGNTKQVELCSSDKSERNAFQKQWEAENFTCSEE